MRVADVLVKCLEYEGVEYIFGVPGEENIDVMDALLDSEIEFIVTRHETSAAFMAGIYGRLTGKPGVCLSTLGPGATNLLTGVANANMDLNPVIAITGQAGLDRQHKISHQYYDLVSIYEPVTKWNAQVKTPEIVPEIIRKAVQVATDEKPGAAHIDLPEDVASMELDASPLKRYESFQSEASDRSVQVAADLIEKADNPLILAGNGITREKAYKSLRTFVDKSDIPVVHTFMGKGAVSWENKNSMLTTGLGGNDYITCGFKDADLILAIGFDMAEYPPERWNPSGNTPILHIDTEKAETDDHYPVALHLVGDMNANLLKLTEVIKKTERDNSWISSVRDQALTELEQFRTNTDYPVKPQKIISDLRASLDKDDIVISDVGAHKMWMARMYHCYKPDTCLITNGLASMGVAVPGAIAAKMANPDKNVVAVCGDGSFQMTSAELETAKRLGLPIIVLMWRDGGYGLIEWKQLNEFDRSSNIKFGNPEFIQLAESYGFEAMSINRTEDLQPCLEQAMSLNKPVFIDCPVDYSENRKLTKKLNGIYC